MRELTIHPAADLFPLLSGQEFDDLVADIRKHGQREPIRLFEGKILDGRNRYRACVALAIEPACLDLPPDLNPWDYAWSANAERRQIEPGQKVMIRIEQRRQSDAWEQLRQAIREEANRKRSDFAVVRPRTDAGTFVPSGVSHDTPLASRDKEKRKTRERDVIAQSAGTSSSTAARALSVDAHRPDLAEKVRLGDIGLSEAVREMKRAEIKERLEEVAAREAIAPTGEYDVIVIDPPWPMEKIEREERPNQSEFDYPKIYFSNGPHCSTLTPGPASRGSRLPQCNRTWRELCH